MNKQEYRSTSSIRPHSLNAEIYGDAADKDLKDSVKKHGVITPLIITEDNVLISGHRRLDAARMAGLDTVPVTVSDLTDPLDIEEAIIQTNSQRKKTREQQGREYDRLKEIEAKRAKKRHGGHDQKSNRENFPELKKGRARDIAAEKAGLGSGKTAENVSKVIKYADKLKEEGRDEDAAELKDTLNNKSANAAGTKMKEMEHQAEKEKPESIKASPKKAPFIGFLLSPTETKKARKSFGVTLKFAEAYAAMSSAIVDAHLAAWRKTKPQGALGCAEELIKTICGRTIGVQNIETKDALAGIAMTCIGRIREQGGGTSKNLEKTLSEIKKVLEDMNVVVPDDQNNVAATEKGEG